jgi:polysaccharide pyruvyl transferase WcaK-like protein
VRSTLQARQARDLGIHHVDYHPDIVFSLRDYIQKANASQAGFGRRLVLNITPRFHNAAPDAVCRDSILDYPVSFSVLRDNYSYLLRVLVTRFAGNGYNIEHIPFAPDDHSVASEILSGLPVWLRPYNPDPFRVIGGLGDGAIWIASRYHSLIFSLLGLHPVLPIAYAEKSVRLLRDLRVDQSSFVDLSTLASRAAVDQVLGRDLPSRPLLDAPSVDQLSFRAVEGISKAITSIGLLGNVSQISN